MIQALEHPGLLYAVKPLTNVAPGARAPRAIQSAAAEALLGTLRQGFSAAVVSKAHARGYVAAAAAGSGQVGIDLEYHDPRRDIVAIAAWLMGARAPDEASAYRAFTFREAYFKASGDWPEQGWTRRAAEGAFTTPDGFEARFETPAERFTLCLVSRGAGLIRRVAP